MEHEVYAPGSPPPEGFDRLPPAEKRGIFARASAFARDFRSSTRGCTHEVTAYFEAGEMRLIFLVDGGEDRQLRGRWRALLRRLNVQATVALPGPSEQRPAAGTWRSSAPRGSPLARSAT